MKTIDTHDWHRFRLGDLFAAARGTGFGLRNIKEGPTPIISAKTTENSIVAYSDIPARFPANTITVTTDGAGMGYATVQPIPFDIASNAVALIPKQTDSIGFHALLFICTFIRNEAHRFSYTDKMRPDRIEALELPLPSKVIPTPNFELYCNTLCITPPRKRGVRYE